MHLLLYCTTYLTPIKNFSGYTTGHSNCFNMAQRAIKNVKEDVLKCPICLDPYENPRILPCEHTLCLECLTKYISEARKRDGTFNSFMCPTCKNKIEIDPKRTVTKWRKHFPSVHSWKLYTKQ